MKRIFPFLLINLGLLLVVACDFQNKVNSQVNLIVTPIPLNLDIEMDQDFDSYYALKKFIQLEANESCYISNIDKLVTTKDSLLIILDKKQQSVFIFDFNGKLISNIKSLGGGPEEYRDIKDITFDPISQSVVVYDVSTSALLYYSIETGKFHKSIKINEEGRLGYRIDYLAGNYIFNRQNLSEKTHPGQLVVTSGDDMRILSSGLPQRDFLSDDLFVCSHPLDVSKDFAYSTDFLNDTIYRIDAASIVPAYYFQYPKDKENDVTRKINEGSKITGDVIDQVFVSQGVALFDNLFVVNDFIFFNFRHNRVMITNLFDFERLKTYSLPYFSIIDEKYFINKPIGKLQNFLISTVTVQNELPSPDENPLLCIYELNIEKLK